MRARRILLSLFTAGLMTTAFAAEPACVLDEDALLRYEQQILLSAQQFRVDADRGALVKGLTPPLMCILEMQEKAPGFLKYLANSFLRPILGGSQTKGLLRDRRYQTAAEALTRLTEKSPDLLYGSLLTLNARGAWDFYKGFCEGKNADSCSAFLPTEEMIRNQSPLLGASSMLLLHRAYHSVGGKEREVIAERIRHLYREIPADETLKSRTIQEIYRELFPVRLS
jgi:hypothetical protein